MDRSKFMHAQLASVGIFLDKPAEPVVKYGESELAPHVVTDEERAEIRAVLVDLGAPEKDLEWLARSCPGLEYALTYRPPSEIAYCAVCDLPRPVDARGCVACAEGWKDL